MNRIPCLFLVLACLACCTHNREGVVVDEQRWSHALLLDDGRTVLASGLVSRFEWVKSGMRSVLGTGEAFVQLRGGDRLAVHITTGEHRALAQDEVPPSKAQRAATALEVRDLGSSLWIQLEQDSAARHFSIDLDAFSSHRDQLPRVAW